MKKKKEEKQKKRRKKKGEKKKRLDDLHFDMMATASTHTSIHTPTSMTVSEESDSKANFRTVRQTRRRH